MKTQQTHRRPHLVRCGLLCGLVTLVAASCQNGGGDPADNLGHITQPAGTTDGGVDAGAQAPACSGTDAHDKHAALGLGCETCHPCGGKVGFSDPPLVLPGGTSTAGGTITPGSPASCVVACHYPAGGAPQAIAWNQTGPLACTDCHGDVGGGPGAVSSHPGFTGDSFDCTVCHDTSKHLSGTVKFVGGIEATCLGCHSGQGQTLSGEAGPVVTPYSDAVSGDWHGARAGSGFGGTLKAPYQRGEPALPCADCHTAHSSANPFLFKSAANGAPIPAGAIQRSGIGAEVLCAGCHEGDRHAGCSTALCHATDPVAAPSPCFYCHGHESIVNFTLPSWTSHPNGPPGTCGHCHSGWFPAQVSTATPVILDQPTVTVTDTTATVSWTTNVKVSAYVEYGTTISGSAGYVAGHANPLSWQPQVTISGLTPSKGYTFRVRSTDAFRNTVTSSYAYFATTGAGGAVDGGAGAADGGAGSPDGGGVVDPTPPTLVPVADVAINANTGITSTTVDFSWSAWVGATQGPTRYNLQLSKSASFATLVADEWITGSTGWQTSLPVPWPPPVPYYWRVKAADDAGSSNWSTVDSFSVWRYDPYGY